MHSFNDYRFYFHLKALEEEKKKKSNVISLNSNWHFQRPSAKTPPYHRRRL